MNKIVTIITPMFNSQCTINETIESVLNQELDSWELIIIDDGSIDNSLQIVEDYCRKDSRIKLLLRGREPKGASTCRNIGIQQASGEFILFLDSDDFLEPFCTRQRLQVMEENPNLEMGIFLMKEFTYKKGDSNKIANMLDSVDPLYDFLSGKFPWTVTSPIWKKNILIELKGFNETINRMQDPDLHVRALLRPVNYKLFYCYPADCYYRVLHAKYTPPDMIQEMIRGYCDFYFNFIEAVNLNCNKIYLKALDTSVNTLLFEVSRMCNDRTMLHEALQIYTKLDLISDISAKYLFIKYMVMQKTIFLLKKIRNIVRKYLLKYDKKVKYEFS
jgi:glycosyltransferase involved in cell wall biosynthesis